MNEKMFLYRYYGDADELLYIGLSSSSLRRMINHEDGSHWFEEVRKMTVEVIMGKYKAMTAERNAISDEGPKYNVAHNKSKRRSSKPLRISLRRDNRMEYEEACRHYGTTMQKVAKSAWEEIARQHHEEIMGRVNRIEAKEK